MVSWPIPQNVTELRGFLGLIGYYRKFIMHYGLIAKPLTQLLREQKFIWSEQVHIAFEALKHAMVSAPVLALQNFTIPFVVETDASDIRVQAVLMQQDQPVAFLSKAVGVVH